MTKGNQKRYGVRRKPGSDLMRRRVKQRGGKDSDLLPHLRPKPLTTEDLERELREKKKRQRGPRVRGKKAPA